MKVRPTGEVGDVSVTLTCPQTQNVPVQWGEQIHTGSTGVKGNYKAGFVEWNEMKEPQ